MPYQPEGDSVQSDPSPLIAPNQTPKYIGPYRIEGLLEKGGMSLLYLGIHPTSQEPVLIKVLSPKYTSNPEVMARFLNEAAIISMADHPNIIKLYDQGQWEGGLYIAMDYIRGISLRKILAQQPFTLKRALEVILKIAYALCHLHTHGVIHRDLKPENILITDLQEVKVIDFGIAQMLNNQDGENKSAVQRLMGTPIYMSPEQKNNPDSVSFQSDIYSLGIIAYELVIGRITHGQIHLSLAPKGLQKILNKALQPRPQDRYQDIVDFIADISHYLHSNEVGKDRQGIDALYQILESLDYAQAALTPEHLPIWTGLTVGASHFKGFGLFGLYYDFLDFPDGSKGFLITEAPYKSADGIIQASMLKAMVKGIVPYCRNTIELLQRLILAFSQDALPPLFKIAYVALDSTFKTLRLYHTPHYSGCFPIIENKIHPQSIQSKQIILGGGENQLNECPMVSFKPAERWMLIGHSLEDQLPFHLAEDPTSPSFNIDIEKYVDLIHHKIRLHQARFLPENHPFCVVCFEHTPFLFKKRAE